MPYELLPNGTLRSAVLSPDSGLTPSCRLLMLALAEYCHPRSCTVFPTQAQLAGDTGLTVRTIRTLMREAMNGGWVLQCENPEHYQIMVPAMSAAPALPSEAKTPIPVALVSATHADHPARLEAKADAERRKAERRASQAREYREKADQVGQYYQTIFNKNAAFRWDDSRRNLVVARLRENEGNVSELLYVIDGCRKSDFHMGRERDGKIKNRVDLLFRGRDEIEQFTHLAGWDGETPHPFLS